jgi:hypothetical protein
MEIVVDDRPYGSSPPPDQTVRELAQEVCAAGEGGDQRIVVSLRCDGSEVGQEGLDAVLDLPARQFRRLDIQTQPAAALVAGTLATAAELLEDSAASRHRVADLLEEGKPGKAMQQFHNLLEAWQHVQQVMLVCAQTLGVDLNALRVHERSLVDVLELLKTQLNELKSAMETRDFVLVSDILRYELDESLHHWSALLNHLAGLTVQTR